MTEPEDFLRRWSRRKREATNERAAKDADASAKPQSDGAPEPSTAASPSNIETTGFDLSKLPPLDSIGPSTDIRVFLQPGVPAALSRAALRRAWRADPTIRDFIGLSENSWDFTAPDSMHGFGTLDPKDAQQLLTQLLGSSNGEKADAPADAAAKEAIDAASGDDGATSSPANTGSQKAGLAARQDEALPLLQSNTEQDSSTASQNDAERAPSDSSARHRSHGRALPR